MLKSLRALFNYVRPSPSRSHRAPDGLRLYAIGDIHGYREVLDAMIDRIAADDAARGKAETHVIFLGDYVDRGPASAAVIDRLSRDLPFDATCHFLKGNHEDAFLRALAGDRDTLSDWLRFGGIETLRSYGVNEQAIIEGGSALIAELAACIPARHRRWLEELELYLRFGSFVFVHAGIRPGLALEEQSTEDLLWIRAPFLNHRGNHGFTVVHGHTITADIYHGHNRIGIDTGVYKSGRLSAIGIEGSTIWSLEARSPG